MTIPDSAITNDEGQVLLRYMKQAQEYVKCGSAEYIFEVRANIAAAWVNEEDVSCMLGYKAGCCGGKLKNVIFLIDETHARRWQYGGGR
jgi:hypothetical protein